VKLSKWQRATALACLSWQLTLGAAAEVEEVPATETLITAEDMMQAGFLDFQQSEEPVLVNPAADAYQFYITDLESRQGAYASGLAEQLVGLGRSYHEQGLFEEAVKVLKRAVHVSRINNGLNDAAQIPLLEQLIQSLIAKGDYEIADERQYYLYRLQRRLYSANDPQMSAAMMRRARWEQQAYALAVGEESFNRLLNMWQLYSRVVNNIAQTEGSGSVLLLEPLNGMVETQYLIAAYDGENNSGIQFGEAGSGNPDVARFDLIQVNNYKQGQAVLGAIRDVLRANENPQSSKSAEALIDLGDWMQWHGNLRAAEEVYREAWAELSLLEDADSLLNYHFGSPQLVPTLSGAHRDLEPPAAISGYAELSYTVNTRGRVYDLELVSNQASEATPDAEPKTLMRRLQRKLFRPRYENGEPVETANITKRYAY
jgi:hypothetical protein